MDLNSSVIAAATATKVSSAHPRDWQSSSFRNDEGKIVYYLEAPAHGPQVGTVVLLPGYGNSSNNYYDTIRNFQERGYAVKGLDWIGQGLSDRENEIDVTDANDRLMNRHLQDLEKFMKTVVLKEGAGPLMMVGHSMGGQIGMKYLKAHPGVFDQAVFGAPLIDLNTAILPRGVFKGIVSALNALGLGDKSLPDFRNLLNRFAATSDNIRDLTTKHPDQLTLTEEGQLRIEQLMKPVQIDLPTWGWIKRTYPDLDQMKNKSYFADIQTPVLFLAGGRDELVSNTAIHFAAKNLPHGQALDLPLATHSIWTESPQNMDKLWQAIDAFRLRPHVPVAPPESPAPVRVPDFAMAAA